MTDGKLIPEFLRPKVEVSHLTPSNIYQLYTTIIGFQGPSNNNAIFNEFMDKMIVLDTICLKGYLWMNLLFVKSEIVQPQIVS